MINRKLLHSVPFIYGKWVNSWKRYIATWICWRLSSRENVVLRGSRQKSCSMSKWVISRDGVGCHTSDTRLKIQSPSYVSISGPPRQLTNRSNTVYTEQCMCEMHTSRHIYPYSATVKEEHVHSYLCDISNSDDVQINDSESQCQRTQHKAHNWLIWCMTGDTMFSGKFPNI